MTTTSREIVQTGIAKFFGGTTYDAATRSYRGNIPAALFTAGLSTVRAHQPKRASDMDFVYQQSAGRGMGASMTVELGDDIEIRRAVPAGSGRKRISYKTTLHLYHLAYQPYMEDAEADVNGLIEAVKTYIRADVSLGAICYQAGENSAGIRTRVLPSALVNEKTLTDIKITFDTEVEIVA